MAALYPLILWKPSQDAPSRKSMLSVLSEEAQETWDPTLILSDSAYISCQLYSLYTRRMNINSDVWYIKTTPRTSRLWDLEYKASEQSIKAVFLKDKAN